MNIDTYGLVLLHGRVHVCVSMCVCVCVYSHTCTHCDTFIHLYKPVYVCVKIDMYVCNDVHMYKPVYYMHGLIHYHL